MTSRNVPIYLFRPLDTTESLYVVGCSQKDTSKNILALMEADDLTQRIPRGHIVQILGPCGDWDTERTALHWMAQPHRQPKLDLALVPPSSEGRLDLRSYRTLNIDPPGCQDVDDCVTFWNGRFVVTIADVGSWVKENPILCNYAKNGQTLYDNGTAVRPMFPKELSEDLFSLRQGQDRFGISVVFERGQTPYWTQSVIRVTESYTYEEADGIPELHQWAEFLAEKSLPKDPHIWVEVYMVTYNLWMAKQLPNTGLLRYHEAPKQELLERYTKICPAASRLAESSAVYAPMESKQLHWGMGLQLYTHMTSPIRRWADVHNQCALLRLTLATDISHLNLIGKRAKKHDRELFFLDQLRTPSKTPLSGIVLEPGKVWVDLWKRTVRTKNTELEPGTHVKITYYLDMNQPTWKRRLVTCVHTDCPV